MSMTRDQLCELTARRLEAASGALPTIKALLGRDGFVQRPIMADALSALGVDVTCIEDPEALNWDNLISSVGRERLKGLLAPCKLVAMVNWSMLPRMTRAWGRLLDEVIPNHERHERKLFIDLADPHERTHEDILEALRMLTRFQDQVDVILGLNLQESLEVADVLALPGRSDPDNAVEENARAIRSELNLSCVVIHPRRGAAAATEAESERFEGPFVKAPRTMDGAGDHFNAGFCLGNVLGLSLAESLCTGVGVSGYYVRHAQSPSIAQLTEFIAHLPPPQA